MPTVLLSGDSRALSMTPVNKMDACTLDNGCAVSKNITGREAVSLRGS